jgi:hypothetical protein
MNYPHFSKISFLGFFDPLKTEIRREYYKVLCTQAPSNQQLDIQNEGGNIFHVKTI